MIGYGERGERMLVFSYHVAALHVHETLLKVPVLGKRDFLVRAEGQTKFQLGAKY